MNDITEPRPAVTADASAAASADGIFTHAALCLVGLPIAAQAEPFRRVVGEAEVLMTPAPDATLPAGRWLRRLLMLICDTALRTDSVAVELCTDLPALGELLGADGNELADLALNYDHLVSGKLAIGFGSGAPLSLFDARGRPRAAAEWRGAVRLGARFLASLGDNKVLLDRAVVESLDAAPLALDAYCWVTHMLAAGKRAGADVPAPMTDWESLVRAFGKSGQPEGDFRPEFEDALRQVSAQCPDLSLVVGESGVQVRQSVPRVRPAPPAPRTDVRATEEMVLKPRPAAAPTQVAAPAPVVQAAPAPRPAPVVERPAPVMAPVNPDAPLRGPRGAIGLKANLTGLTQVIWLNQSNGQDDPIIEVTPGFRYDSDNVTQLALEPMVIQISGGLYQREFERVSAWAMANRDLIDDVWEGEITAIDEINARVKKVPAPGWR